MPPIFQPEVAAEAIVWAADHDRRELFVGWPTVEAIVGNKIAPGWLDHYLARNGFDTQMTDEPEDPDRPDNLWEPVPGDHGAHGRFDRLARSSSWQLWADTAPRLAGRRRRLPRRPGPRRTGRPPGSGREFGSATFACREGEMHESIPCPLRRVYTGNETAQ